MSPSQSTTVVLDRIDVGVSPPAREGDGPGQENGSRVNHAGTPEMTVSSNAGDGIAADDLLAQNSEAEAPSALDNPIPNSPAPATPQRDSRRGHDPFFNKAAVNDAISQLYSALNSRGDDVFVVDGPDKRFSRIFEILDQFAPVLTKDRSGFERMQSVGTVDHISRAWKDFVERLGSPVYSGDLQKDIKDYLEYKYTNGQMYAGNLRTGERTPMTREQLNILLGDIDTRFPQARADADKYVAWRYKTLGEKSRQDVEREIEDSERMRSEAQPGFDANEAYKALIENSVVADLTLDELQAALRKAANDPRWLDTIGYIDLDAALNKMHLDFEAYLEVGGPDPIVGTVLSICESNNQEGDAAESPVGARGRRQFMPTTGEVWIPKYRRDILGEVDPAFSWPASADNDRDNTNADNYYIDHYQDTFQAKASGRGFAEHLSRPDIITAQVVIQNAGAGHILGYPTFNN